MKIWYFHGQYIRNGFRTNEMLYNIFDLRHMSNLAAECQKNKKKDFIYSLKYPNKESTKLFKNEAALPYLEPFQISMTEPFCENTMVKNFIAYV